MMRIRNNLSRTSDENTHFDERERNHHRHKRRRHRRAWGKVRQGCLRAVRWSAFNRALGAAVMAKLTLETESEGLIPGTIRRKQNNPAEIRSHDQLRRMASSGRALRCQSVLVDSPTSFNHRLATIWLAETWTRAARGAARRPVRATLIAGNIVLGVVCLRNECMVIKLATI
jgi:hypothetical protein